MLYILYILNFLKGTFLSDTMADFLDDDEFIEDGEEKLIYRGQGFTIKADESNGLECVIVRAFQGDSNLQRALHFTDPNRLFHSEIYLGQHIEHGLRFEGQMSRKYDSWRKDSPLLRPLIMWHDIAKAWEGWYPLPEEPLKMGHREIAAMITPGYLDVEDEQFSRLVLHHDDYYKLYKRRNNAPMEDLGKTFQGFSSRDFEILVRFIHCDCYRPQPKETTARCAHRHQQKLYRGQIEWFVQRLKESRLLPLPFEPFS